MKTSHLKLPDIRFRFLYTTAIIVLTVLCSVIIGNTGSLADPLLSKWHSVPLPRQGDIGGWVLAEGSDLSHLTVTDDGTLYCAVENSGAPSRLFRSTDNGTSWRYTGSAATIVDIEMVPGRPHIIYYSDGVDIYRSDNKGIHFTALPHLGEVVPSDNISITTFDVVGLGAYVAVIAGTTDSDSGETGGVYLLTDNGTNPSWSDTGLNGYDVDEIILSVYYSIDTMIYAVANDESRTWLTIKNNLNGWSGNYAITDVANGVVDDATIVVSQYDPVQDNQIVYLGIDTANGTGDVYRVDIAALPDGSVVHDLNIGSNYGQYGTDVASLVEETMFGEPVLIAGSADSGDVFRSTDSGTTWTKSLRPPTGAGDTNVLVDSEGHICAVTVGDGSAYSTSSDGGKTFDQISLIDTEISNSCILDIAPSPLYSTDTTVFMLTLDINSMEYSLWRSVSADIAWKRILGTSAYPNTTIERVMLPPTYGDNEPVIYMYGLTDGDPELWRSDDNGSTFTQTDVPFPIDTWTSIDSDTLYIGCHDGTNGRVFTTEDGGQSWSGGPEPGILTLASIERSPDYENDMTLFVSNLGGWVYYSDDEGYTYRTLPLDSVAPPFAGKVMVKTDPLFSENGIIYAVSGGSGGGIFRFIIGESEEWERLDNSLPTTSTISDIHLTESGILYATNTDNVDTSAEYGGVERSLNPSWHLYPSFDSLYFGLDDTVFLRQSWISGNRIWAIDASSDRLMTYIDTLTEPVIQLSPWNGETTIDSTNAIIDWLGAEGATEYEWEIDFDGSFTELPSGFSGTTGATSVHLPDLDASTRYFWRVRVTEPASSPWSERFSFVTGSGDALLCPDLLFPEAGAELTSSKPLFQWGPIAGAEKYELVVSSENDFSVLSIKMTGRQSVSGTAWQSETELAPDTVYYWKVRGKLTDGYSDWSAVSAFRLVSPAHTEHASSLAGAELPILQDQPVLLCPGYGTDPADSRPLFQWDAVPGAECYELMVSTDTRFENPVIVKAGEYSVPISAWRSNIALEPDTAYYWKVRAVMNESYGTWSPVSAFLVGEEPDQGVNGAEIRESERIDGEGPTTVVLPDGNGLPQWAVFMGLGLLIVIAMLQIAILVAFLLTRGRKI